MTKTYQSHTCLSINVVLDSGANKHIAFIPLSDGTSRYMTQDKELMEALEHHHNFGVLFYLHSVEDEKLPKDEEKDAQSVADEGEAKGVASLLKIAVSDLADAKDYLADTFDIARTSLRSKKAIIDAALAHGVEFEGLE